MALLGNVLLVALAAAAGALCTYLWLRRTQQEFALAMASAADESEALRHGLEERLAALEATLRNLEIPMPPPADLGPVIAIVVPLQKRLTAIEHALFPLQTRLDELESALRALHMQPSQLEPVLRRLQAIDERLPQPRRRRVAVRDGSRNLLSHAGHGKPDDLTQIQGVPRMLERTLHKVGVFYFWQIAEWSSEDVKYVDRQLAGLSEGLGGCIERDAWVAQAGLLAAAPDSAHRPPVRH
jgi:predicted flap endonuclease-1-like 5' DNA nuclease